MKTNLNSFVKTAFCCTLCTLLLTGCASNPEAELTSTWWVKPDANPEEMLEFDPLEEGVGVLRWWVAFDGDGTYKIYTIGEWTIDEELKDGYNIVFDMIELNGSEELKAYTTYYCRLNNDELVCKNRNGNTETFTK